MRFGNTYFQENTQSTCVNFVSSIEILLKDPIHEAIHEANNLSISLVFMRKSLIGMS